MKTLRFKTNIKCGACVATVTPALNTLPSLQTWKVDLQHPDRILTVEGQNLNVDLIIETLKHTGYAASLLPTTS